MVRRVACVCGFVLGSAAAMGQLSIDWYTIDSGGGVSSGPTITVMGTIGQHDAGPTMSGPTISVTGGFWAGVAAMGPSCRPDLTTTNTNPGDPGYGSPDGTVNGADLSYYVEQWFNATQFLCVPCAAIADVTTTETNPGDPSYGVPDGTVNGTDLSFYVELWINGCP